MKENGKVFDFIADTSAVILAGRGNPDAGKAIKDKRFAITFVTMAEISYGVLKAAKNDAAWSQIMNVIVNQTIIHVSPNTPAIYARILYDLERRGFKIPTNDIWIAAVAIEARVPLLARDEHFSKVNGLAVIRC